MMNFHLYKELSAHRGTMQLDIELVLKQGELMALFGPSGSGKTSLLRMLTGLMKPDKGYIQFDKEIWYDGEKNIHLNPRNRDIGMVFQDYALFPNMNVLQNLRYALKKSQDPSILDELIAIMDLEGLTHQYPRTLSGGQQQRVALARALVQRPKVLLLDEPLSALDPEMRKRLQSYLLKVHRQFGLTSILVSHDPEEILRMADLIIVIEGGKVVEKGKPLDIIRQLSHIQSISLEGMVKHIHQQGEESYIEIQIGEQIVKHYLSESNLNEFQIGEKGEIEIFISHSALKT